MKIDPEMLENESYFDEKFNELNHSFKIKSCEEVKQQVRLNKNILIFIEDIKPYLEKDFSDAELCLEMNFEPEMDDRYIILRINVPRERFLNDMDEEIIKIRSEIRPLRRKFNVLRDLAIMSGISVK